MRAFIFSSLGDREMAAVCRARLALQGVDAVIVLDAHDGPGALGPGEMMTDFPRGGRLFGSAAAIGIAETMRDHAGGHEVVCKVDADTLMLPEAVAWLAAATTKAHGYSVNRTINWWGLYAIPSAAMADVAAMVRRIRHCETCGENSIFHHALRLTCGTARAHADAVQVWRSGRQIKAAAQVLTLPTGLGSGTRRSEGETMFAMDERDRCKTAAMGMQEGCDGRE